MRPRQLMLAADQRSPTAARRFVANVLEEVSAEPPSSAADAADSEAENLSALLDDALLLTTELVTNAVVHAGTTLPLGLELVRSTDPEPAVGLTIMVTDRVSGPLPPSM